MDGQAHPVPIPGTERGWDHMDSQVHSYYRRRPLWFSCWPSPKVSFVASSLLICQKCLSRTDCLFLARACSLTCSGRARERYRIFIASRKTICRSSRMVHHLLILLTLLISSAFSRFCSSCSLVEPPQATLLHPSANWPPLSELTTYITIYSPRRRSTCMGTS